MNGVRAALFALVLGSTGCIGNYDIPLTVSVGDLGLAQRRPERVALLIPEEAARHVAVEVCGNCTGANRIPLGPAFETSAREAFGQAFQSATVIRSIGEAEPGQIVLAPRIERFSHAKGLDRMTSSVVVAVAVLRDGKRVWERSFASSETPGSPFHVTIEAYQQSVASAVGGAMRDALAAAARVMVGDAEVAALLGGAPRETALADPDRSAPPPGSTQPEPVRAPAADAAAGVFAIDRETAFNVLDAVEFRPASREIVFIGHYDDRYGGRRIPYFQHLATLLDNPAPEFSLDWTPHSERQVDAFLKRMDSLDEMRNLEAVSGQWLGRDGLPTPQGRVMLPLLGVKPTRNGSPRSGFLGGGYSLNSDLEGVRVDQVTAGSAAARAGLRVGDVILFFDKRQVLHPIELTREVAFAGAGAEVLIVVSRDNSQALTLTATLDASPDDPWRQITRHDLGAQMLQQIGMEKGAGVLLALGQAKRLVATPVGPKLAFVMFGATDTWDAYEAISAAVQRGEISQPEGARRMQRAVVVGTEEAFRLAAGALTSSFDEAMRRGMTSGQAFTEAMTRLDEKIEPLLKDMLRTLLRRNDEIVLPVSEIERNIGARPEVVPRFDGLAPDSVLARVMFEADYLGKALLFRPELKAAIPGYQTEYGFAPGRGQASPITVTRRMWISVDAVEAGESPGGGRLVIREARMRFNVRDVRASRDLPPESGGYEALLTSLYEPLSQEFPVLHELREAAKLARAASWIRSKEPEFRLPAEGRTRWAAPARLPGIVHLIWSPQRVSVSMVAAGGVSLKVPPVGPSGPLVQLLPYPPTGSVQIPLDEREIGALTVRPQRFDNQTLAAVLRRKVDVPVPRPLGWVTPADKGRRTALALAMPPAGAACRPAAALALDRDLAAARRLSDQLEVVEDALNAITRENPDRQALYTEIAGDIDRTRTAFVKNLTSVLSQGILDTYDDIAGPYPAPASRRSTRGPVS